jgi:hypothetical protein
MITTLNNSISNSILDFDAREFIDTCGITSSNIIRNINDCFKELKRSGIWDSIYYGFAMIYSGTSQSMLVDIKSRQSLNSYIPISGPTTSATYSTTGIQYNGGEFLAIDNIPFGNIINSDSAPGHISIYNRTDYNSIGLTLSSKHGYREIFGGYEQSFSFTNTGVSGSLWNAAGPMGFSVSNTSGFFLFSNVDDNDGIPASISNPYKFYMSRNGQILGSQSSVKNYHTFGSNIVIGAFTENLLISLESSFDEICWYSIGSGFGYESQYGRQIDIEKQEIYFQIIQKLQKSLSREKDT